MATFEQLNVEAFWENPKKEFERVSGPRPEWNQDYKGVSSVIKKKLMWDFFLSPRATDAMLDSKTVYSGRQEQEQGVTIREMLEEMQPDSDGTTIHSIEHVIPKTKYILVPLNAQYPRLQQEVINGATLNPMNFLPLHAAHANLIRNERLFDFEGEAVTTPTLANVDGEARRFEGGRDAQGQWVPPIVSRGDVARCVVFMELSYRLDYVNEHELLVLQKWMKEDAPSNFQRQYGLWILETMPLGGRIQNPLVSCPELATNDAMFDALVKGMLNKDLPRNRRPSPSIHSVTIDSVLPNPGGYDTSGAELVSIRNNSSVKISLDRWVLEIVVRYLEQDKVMEYGLNDIELNRTESVELWFPDDNVLPNSRNTTIRLLDRTQPGDEVVVSSFSYKGAAVRSGRMLTRLGDSFKNK